MRRMYGLVIGLSVTMVACGVETESRAPSSLDSSEEKVDAPTDPGACANDPGGECVVGVLGDGACADIVDFKLQASGDLCDDGLYLSTFDVDTAGCPDGQALVAKYSCCSPPPPSEQPDKPAPGEDPGPSNCTIEELAVDACAAISFLEADAGATCAVTGAALVDRKFGGDCADGDASQMWFTCCVAP